MTRKHISISLTLCIISIFFSSCNNAESSSESSNIKQDEEITSEITHKTTEQLLANEKNIAGNGYIVINDEADFPEYMKEYRCTLGVGVEDFWGNEILSSHNSIKSLLYNCGLSSYQLENGLYGFVDYNGDFVIEPQFKSASFFSNGTAKVSDDNGEYYIDTNGNKTENMMFKGYNGSFDKHDFYGAFTGKYLLFGDVNNETAKTSYGYSDADGNDYYLENLSEAYSFVNGYALVKTVAPDTNDSKFFFIDEEFNQVTDFSNPAIETLRSLILNNSIIVNLHEEGLFCVGFEYVLEGGYFVVNEGSGFEPKLKLVKICPELYNAE